MRGRRRRNHRMLQPRECRKRRRRRGGRARLRDRSGHGLGERDRRGRRLHLGYGGACDGGVGGAGLLFEESRPGRPCAGISTSGGSVTVSGSRDGRRWWTRCWQRRQRSIGDAPERWRGERRRRRSHLRRAEPDVLATGGAGGDGGVGYAGMGGDAKSTLIGSIPRQRSSIISPLTPPAGPVGAPAGSVQRLEAARPLSRAQQVQPPAARPGRCRTRRAERAASHMQWYS